MREERELTELRSEAEAKYSSRGNCDITYAGAVSETLEWVLGEGERPDITGVVEAHFVCPACGCEETGYVDRTFLGDRIRSCSECGRHGVEIEEASND